MYFWGGAERICRRQCFFAYRIISYVDSSAVVHWRPTRTISAIAFLLLPYSTTGTPADISTCISHISLFRSARHTQFLGAFIVYSPRKIHSLTYTNATSLLSRKIRGRCGSQYVIAQIYDRLLLAYLLVISETVNVNHEKCNVYAC